MLRRAFMASLASFAVAVWVVWDVGRTVDRAVREAFGG